MRHCYDIMYIIKMALPVWIACSKKTLPVKKLISCCFISGVLINTDINKDNDSVINNT